jgi:serine/threonine protein kinase
MRYENLRFTENEAKKLFSQLVSAVDHVHEQGIW